MRLTLISASNIFYRNPVPLILGRMKREFAAVGTSGQI